MRVLDLLSLCLAWMSHGERHGSSRIHDTRSALRYLRLFLLSRRLGVHTPYKRLEARTLRRTQARTILKFARGHLSHASMHPTVLLKHVPNLTHEIDANHSRWKFVPSFQKSSRRKAVQVIAGVASVGTPALAFDGLPSGLDLVAKAKVTGLAEYDDEAVAREAQELLRRLPAETPLLQLPPRSPGVTRLIFVRHGRAICNRFRIARGRRVDDVLDAVGRLQAKRVGEALREVNIDAVFTSTLRRAKETASLAINGGAGQSNVLLPLPLGSALPSLDEWDLGELEGSTGIVPRLREGAQEVIWKVYPDSSVAPDAESLRDIESRAKLAVETILASAPPEGSTVLVTTHGGLLLHLLQTVLKSSQYMYLMNCCVSVIDFDGKNPPRPVVINSVAHLREDQSR